MRIDYPGMAETLKIGDVVMLKSGGPKMTVTGVDKEASTREPLVNCMWFDGNELDTSSFAPGALERANRPGGQ